MKNKKDNIGGPDSAQIRSQAEQKARAIKPPALESMTWEEIRQTFHEMQVKQLAAELETEQLRARLEDYTDYAALFTKITENILDLVILTDPSGNLKFIGNSLEILGYEPQSLIGHNLMDFVHPGDLNSVLETYADFVAGGDPPRIRFRCRCGDGSHLWAETRGAFLRDGNGNPQEIVFSLRDITEQKATEEALRKSEEKFRQLFERAEEGILIVSGETVDFANPALEGILEYPMGRITSKPFAAFIHPDDRETVLDLHFRIMRHEFSEKQHDFRIVTSDGTEKWVTVNGQIIEWEGEPANLCFVMDITDRKRAEQRLKESEERFSKAFRSSPAPQIISDIDTGAFIDANDRWMEMLGYTRKQFFGRSSKEVGIWADPGERDRIVQKLYKHGFFKDEPVEFRTSAGGTVYALWSAEAITLGNRHVMLSMIYDRTGHKQMEDALSESEQRLSLALDAVSDGVWDWRIDSNSVSFSPRWYTMLGYEPYELPETFETWRRLLHPADLPEAERVVDRHLTSAEPFELEFRMKAKDGRLQWIFARGKTVEKDAEGNALRMLGTHMDITGRKLAEQQLRESEEKYRRIAENITDVVWTTDLNLNPTFVSSSVQKLLGETPEEHMRRTMAEKYPPVYLEKIYRVLAEELEKEKNPASDKNRTRLLEVEHYKADGSTIWVAIHISTIRDENASLAGLQGVTRDVTERRQAEEALRNREKILSTIIETAQDAILMMDSRGRISHWNSSAERLLGYTADEALGQNLHYLLAPKRYHDLYDKACLEFQKSGRGDAVGKTLELEALRKNGEEVPVELSLSSVSFEDGWHAVGTVRDITWRKEAEKEQERLQSQLAQAQKMESVGRLAGGVAHDFNNKLTIINGYAEMAIDMLAPSAPLRETIQEIYTAGKKSADIVRQLLAFARQQTTRPVRLDLNNAISGMLKMLHRLIGENIDLAWHPGKNLWPVKIDPSQLDQILANLAVNSRDAIADVGRITIETKNIGIDEDYCRLYPYFVPGQYVRLAVSDNGSGMDKKTLGSLFEPFFTTKEVGKGTGLGLAMVYGIVKQNNGFINVYSEPENGTTIKIYLPRHATEEFSVKPETESAGQVPGGTETLLIVEDEKPVLQMSRQILEKLGYTVYTAENPGAALKLSEQYHKTIHMLITDVVMPEMNGRDLASQMVMTRPGLKTLYMSGYTADAIAHNGVLDEGVRFIQKPFSVQELAVEVREALEQ